MTHTALQSAIRQTIALYARKRDGATDKAERAYYGRLWQEAVDRLHKTLLFP